MPENKFKFTIKGRAGVTDLVRLDDFAKELAGIYETLTKLDKLVSKKREATMLFRIVGLGILSPATVEVEATPREDMPDFTEQVGHRFVSGISSIQRGEIPNDFDAPLVNSFRQIGAAVKSEIASIDVSYGEENVSINKHLEEVIGKALGGIRYSHGSISGMLEYLNFHSGRKEFRIYPAAGPSYIICYISEKDREMVKNGVDRHVTVKGRMSFKPREKFPFSIEVAGINIHPPDNELPSFLSLRGSARGATGGLSSEEYIGRVRSGE